MHLRALRAKKCVRANITANAFGQTLGSALAAQTTPAKTLANFGDETSNLRLRSPNEFKPFNFNLAQAGRFDLSYRNAPNDATTGGYETQPQGDYGVQQQGGYYTPDQLADAGLQNVSANSAAGIRLRHGPFNLFGFPANVKESLPHFSDAAFTKAQEVRAERKYLLTQSANGFASSVLNLLFGGEKTAPSLTRDEYKRFSAENDARGFLDKRSPVVNYSVDFSTLSVSREISSGPSLITHLKNDFVNIFSLGLVPLGESLGTFAGGANIAADTSLSPLVRGQGAFDLGGNALSVPAAAFAFVSPLIPAKAPPNVNFNPNIRFHLENVERFSQADGLAGGHTAAAFESAVTQYNLNIVRETPGLTPGVKKIEYQVPSFDNKGAIRYDATGNIIFKKSIFTKSVFDPSVLPTQSVLEAGRAAATNGYNNAIYSQVREFSSSFKGTEFQIYLDLKTGVITNFFPK